MNVHDSSEVMGVQSTPGCSTEKPVDQTSPHNKNKNLTSSGDIGVQVTQFGQHEKYQNQKPKNDQNRQNETNLSPLSTNDLKINKKFENSKKSYKNKNKQTVLWNYGDSPSVCSHKAKDTGLEQNSQNFQNHEKIQVNETISDKISVGQENEIKLQQLLETNDNIFAKSKYDVGLINIEPQKVVLTTDLPISIRPYRTAPKEQEEIDQQIEKLLEAGIIEESCSPFSSPITMVFKKDEGKRSRLCIDYRKINSVTKRDCEPLPRIDVLLDKLSKANWFSQIDMASGYWHVPLSSDASEKLAFSTNKGLYQFKRLPFGFCNSPQVFSRTLRRILSKHHVTFACNYFDDIIVFSNTYEEHLEHLEIIFDICQQENLKLKRSKCNFAKTEIQFLGYEVGNGKITPANANIETIQKLIPPKNVKGLQRFLGSINVYHRFIPKYASIRAPLNNLLKKNVTWNWTTECQTAFEKLKNSLTCKPILHLFDAQREVHVFVDASKSAVGAVLKQPGDDGALYPIAYHSRALHPYEKNYAITELECLAIVDTLDKFHCYLFGQKFTIHTDHHSLIWLKNIKKLTGRLFRWSLKISMYQCDIKYKKGTTNIEADMLSRQHSDHHTCHLLDKIEIETEQNNVNLTGKSFHDVNGILCVKRKGFTKIVVPHTLRLKLLNEAHSNFGHPGIQKMLDLISPVYYWPNITQDVKNFVKHCETCQFNKKPRQKRFGLLQQMPPTENPFEILAIDTVGGFNYYNSTKKFLHLVIDHATRYIWAFASKNETSETYANCLSQVFQMQTPEKLLSDRNPAFTSSRFKKFLRNNNVKQLLTSSHHPESNGKVERVNQSICTRLRCQVNSSSDKIPWTRHLETVIQQYNNTPHAVTKFPPAYLLFGILPYHSPLDSDPFYPPVAEARIIAAQRTKVFHDRNKIRYDARFTAANFEPGDIVIYEEFKYPNSRKLTQPFSGPYTVCQKLSDVNYEIDKPNAHAKKETEVVHSSKLRYFYPSSQLKLSHE